MTLRITRRSGRLLGAVAAAVVFSTVGACRPSTPASPPGMPSGKDGDVCAVAGVPTRACDPLYDCRPVTPAPLPPDAGPNGPLSTESCGGIGGFQCVEGLVCQM